METQQTSHTSPSYHRELPFFLPFFFFFWSILYNNLSSHFMPAPAPSWPPQGQFDRKESRLARLFVPADLPEPSHLGAYQASMLDNGWARNTLVMACVSAALLPQWFTCPRTTAWLQPALCHVLHSQPQLRPRGAASNHRHLRLLLKHHQTRVIPLLQKPSQKKYCGKHYIHTAATNSASKLTLIQVWDHAMNSFPAGTRQGSWKKLSNYLFSTMHIQREPNNALQVWHNSFFGKTDQISLETPTPKMELCGVQKPTVVLVLQCFYNTKISIPLTYFKLN